MKPHEAITALRAMLAAPEAFDEETLRRLALRVTAPIADKERAFLLHDSLLTTLTALMLGACLHADDRSRFLVDANDLLDNIEAVGRAN